MARFVLRLAFWGVLPAFLLISRHCNIFEGIHGLTIFWINMRAGYTNSYKFPITLMLKWNRNEHQQTYITILKSKIYTYEGLFFIL